MKGLALHGAPPGIQLCGEEAALVPGATAAASVAGTPKQKCGSDGGTVVGRGGYVNCKTECISQTLP